MILGPQSLLLLFFMMAASMMFFYVILRIFNISRPSTNKKDRKIIEDLGNRKIEYSDPYFAKLTQPARVGENLPTQNCEGCGGALNPEDVYCSKCGEPI